MAVLAGIAGGAILVGGHSTALHPSGSPSPLAAGRSPLIAMVDLAGALATLDATGRRTALDAEPGVTFGFPTWSPDGSRVAVVRSTALDASISMFGVRPGSPGTTPAPTPVVVYRSSDAPPFYLYWAPDGTRITFLATETDGISLRIAPADGSAPLDGSGAGAVIRHGTPLYFDWVTSDRLLLHVGSGNESFLGEIGLDGASVGQALGQPGDFRAAVVGADARFMAFARGTATSGELVVAARDGSAQHTVPVFGPAAMVFDPAGKSVASIAPDQPTQAGGAFPIGPLRLIDAESGVVRTLLDGTVIGFFWSPDGQTIAALRLQAEDGSTVAARPIVAAAAISSPTASPTRPASPELHLVFVDVAGGRVRSDRVVRPTSSFINQFLPYFDQYALSHRVWSPDSTSILLPVVDELGRSQLVGLPPDGGDPLLTLAGESGFWSS